MEDNIFEENKKPTLKELFLDYKEKHVGPIQRKFNAIYVIITLIAYFFYLGYGITHIAKYGLEEPISILLLIAIIVYTLILIVCVAMSSSIKTARKRINKSMKVFRFFKRSITIVSSAVAIIALFSTLQADKTSGWAVFVSILSLFINAIKITFAIFTMTISAGFGVLKFGAKQTVKHYKKKVNNKKSAPAIDTDADKIDSNE